MNSITTKRLNNVRFADQFAGADAGAQIQACINDLPRTPTSPTNGGVCDARGLMGTQSIGGLGVTISTHGTTLLLSPGASYNVSATITVSAKGVAIIGGAPQLLAEVAGTTLKWTGGSGGGPIIKVSDGSNYFRAENLSLDCNALATHGLQIDVSDGSATKRPVLRNIEYRGYRVSGLLVGGTPVINLDSGQMEGALFESQTFRGGGVAKTWSITGTGASRTSNMVTITTTAPHGLLVNDPVVIAGVTDTSFNGIFLVASVPSSTTFTYSEPPPPLPNTTSGNGTANLMVTAIIQNAQNIETSTWLNTYIDPCSGTCGIWVNHYYHIYNRIGAMNMLSLTSTRADSFAIYAYDAVSVRNWRTEDRYLVTTPFTAHSQPMTLEDVDNRGWTTAVDIIEWNITGNVSGGTATGAGLSVRGAHLLGNVAVGDTGSGEKRYVSLDNVRFENNAGLVLRTTGGTRDQYIAWHDVAGSREFIHGGPSAASLVLETGTGSTNSPVNLKWNGTTLSADRNFAVSRSAPASGTASIKTENTDTDGTDSAAIQFKTGVSSSLWQWFARNGELFVGVNSVADYWKISSAGHFQAPTDNTYDIGASGANRPRDVYLARNLSLGSAGSHVSQAAATNDISGQIAISAATGASKTFTTAYGSAPFCVVSPTADPGAGLRWWVTSTTTAVTVTLSALFTLTFNYVCFGAPN